MLALVAGVGYGAYWGVSTVRAPFPQTTGTLRLAGLAGPVDVKRDAYGVPQIYASTDEDLFRAQGYVQAQDRFWEMDVRRHMIAGRLSELLGDGLVDTDAFLRTLGWHRVAKEEYDTKLSEETKKNLQAYADGVNAYLEDKQPRDVSVEYSALAFAHDYTIEPWTPVDSVAWLKAMAWDLRGNMEDEIDRSLMLDRLSPEQVEQLSPRVHRTTCTARSSRTSRSREQTPTRTPAVVRVRVRATARVRAAARGAGTGNGTGAGAGFQGGAQGGANGLQGSAGGQGPTAARSGLQAQLSGLSEALDDIPALLGPNGNGIGSNSWVVSGEYTTTGKPLLANDPHLAPQLPSVWYQMGLHCRPVSATCGYDVAGYSFAGMPGVVIGHNQDIAWGMTNLGTDVTDLYLEKVTDRATCAAARKYRSRPVKRSSRSRAAAAAPSPCAPPTTAPSSPTAATSRRRSARRRPSPTARPTAATDTPWHCAGPHWTRAPPWRPCSS